MDLPSISNIDFREKIHNWMALNFTVSQNKMTTTQKKKYLQHFWGYLKNFLVPEIQYDMTKYDMIQYGAI